MTSDTIEIRDIPVADTETGKPHYAQRPLWLAAAILACGSFFCLISPTLASPVVLIAGFTALGVSIAAGFQLLLVVTGLHRRLGPGLRRGILTGVVSMPILLLVLQSIGQLTVRDVITLGGLFLIGIFYVNRVRKSTI